MGRRWLQAEGMEREGEEQPYEQIIQSQGPQGREEVSTPPRLRSGVPHLPRGATVAGLLWERSCRVLGKDRSHGRDTLPLHPSLLHLKAHLLLALTQGWRRENGIRN